MAEIRNEGRQAPPGIGMVLGRVAGIELRLDASVAVIFALVVGVLGVGTLPSWHPEWSALEVWAVAAVAGLLLLASILVHELAHSVVANRLGLAVPRITLFVFGGVSELESEPTSPGQELAIAIVGPVVSLVIGFCCILVGSALLPADFTDLLRRDPRAAMASVDAVATLLLWLGPVNLVLGAFNLVPGFPLDGGRVLRAALWKITGDRVVATEWASRAGQLAALILMAIGIVMVFRGRLDGLWLLLIGWFLFGAARTSHWRMVLEHFLEHLHVSDLMRTGLERVPRGMPLETFVDDLVRRSDQGVWPVVDEEGRTVGTIAETDLRFRDRPLEGTVADFMQPISTTLTPDATGVGALNSLIAAGGRRPVLVVDHGDVVGLLKPGDIARWMMVAELRGA